MWSLEDRDRIQNSLKLKEGGKINNKEFKISADHYMLEERHQ